MKKRLLTAVLAAAFLLSTKPAMAEGNPVPIPTPPSGPDPIICILIPFPLNIPCVLKGGY